MENKMLDNKIETFMMVAHLKSYTKAAESLFISQPAVSQQIRQLEEEFGVKLFNYEKRKLFLTTEGKELLKFAESVKVQTKNIKIKMKLSDKQSSPLNFATTFSLSNNDAWKIVDSYRSQRSKKIVCQTFNTQQCLEALNNGKIDFALIEGNFKQDDYDKVIIRNEPFIAVGKRELGIEANKEYDLRELINYPLIYREQGSGSLEITRQILGMRNLSPIDFKQEYQIGSLSLFRRMLLDGVGIGFCYQCLLTDELDDRIIQKIKIKNMEVAHPISLVWLKGNDQLKEEIQVVKEILK